MRTAYGTWTFGDLFASVPHYGGDQFYVPLLNGVPANPAGSRLFTDIWSQFFFVGYGGQLYTLLTGDQLIAGWSLNSWQGDTGQTGPDGFPGAGGVQVPLGSPPLATLPSFVWAGPYTPSPDGTSISGGTGSLTTADGFWTFGTARGGGSYDLVLNGVPVSVTAAGPTAYTATNMQVNSHGCLFFQMPDTTWQVWNCHQANPSRGPTSSPIPIQLNFSPPLPIVPMSSSVGTFLTMVTTMMSDRSTFTGTLTIGLDPHGQQSTVAMGSSTLVTNITPFNPQGPVTVTATQNGSSIVAQINAGGT